MWLTFGVICGLSLSAELTDFQWFEYPRLTMGWSAVALLLNVLNFVLDGVSPGVLITGYSSVIVIVSLISARSRAFRDLTTCCLVVLTFVIDCMMLNTADQRTYTASVQELVLLLVLSATSGVALWATSKPKSLLLNHIANFFFSMFSLRFFSSAMCTISYGFVKY